MVQAKELLMATVWRLVDSYEHYEEEFPLILLDSSLEGGSIVSYYPPYNDMMFCIKKVIDEVGLD